jgi:AraC family transcriptional regulator of adaptative response/methylated-DNA-[protein]-cysteine methyltransferase
MRNGHIKYRDIDSPLGTMIAGATGDGVCFLEWHDRGGVEKIKQKVARRYMAALEQGTNKHLDLLESELKSYFSGNLKHFSVPVDISGTAFEKQVWGELSKLPYGKTASYGQISASIGKPKASRAVGRANGANYLSIVIPCHRVVEANGNLRGYGGKLWRKRWLLDLERKSI